MTKRILLVLLASLAIGVQAFAQNVSGKVADAKGEAIPGASVIIKGTTTGTMTDLDGAYQLNAGSNATLSSPALATPHRKWLLAHRKPSTSLLLKIQPFWTKLWLSVTVPLARGTSLEQSPA